MAAVSWALRIAIVSLSSHVDHPRGANSRPKSLGVNHDDKVTRIAQGVRDILDDIPVTIFG